MKYILSYICASEFTRKLVKLPLRVDSVDKLPKHILYNERTQPGGAEDPAWTQRLLSSFKLLPLSQKCPRKQTVLFRKVFKDNPPR